MPELWLFSRHRRLRSPRGRAGCRGNGVTGRDPHRLAALEPTSFWFRARNELVAWALERYFPRARSFFELGTGTGFVLAGVRKRFPDLRLAGGEPVAAALDIARSRLPDTPLFQLDGRRLPFDQEFDVVGAFDVLEHIDEDERVVSEIFGATRSGGGALISVPQHPRLWSAADEFSQHRRRYTAEELRAKVESAGFELARMTSFVLLLLPLVALSRWRSRGSGEAYDPATEYRLPRSLDAVLERVMALERFFIRQSLSMPAGSSLLVAARRP